MFRSCVNFELAENLRSKLVFREHTLDSVFDDQFRFRLHHFSVGRFLTSAEITGMCHVSFLIQLFACQFNLVCIQLRYVVTAVYVRCKAGLVFP